MCEPCSDSTVKFTQLKDEQYIGTITSVDQAVKAFRQDQIINGCALGVVQNDEIVYLKGYGLADVAAHRPFTVGTPSLVGSIAKTITALGALVLVEEGYLNLDDPINDHVPIADSSLAGITIQDLLSHTSGITHNWPNFGGIPSTEFASFPTDEDDLKILYPSTDHPGIHPRLAYLTYYAHNEFDPEAAESGNYASTNFTLLGAIIDQITSSPGYSGPKGYEAFVWEKVCQPADILSPCLAAEWRLDTIHNLAQGYTVNNSEQVWPNILWGWEGPAGGWTMTIGDLARLMIAINTDKVISAETRAAMMQVYISSPLTVVEPELPVKFGLGVLKFTAGGVGYMHHGDIDGYTARYTFYNQSGIGIVLLFNKYLVNKSAIGSLTEQIRDLFTDDAVGGITFTDEDRGKQRSAVYRVVTEYGDNVRRLAKLLQYRTGSPNEVVPTGIKLLVRAEGERGKRLLRYYNAEQYEKAAEVALDIFESRRRRHIPQPPEEFV